VSKPADHVGLGCGRDEVEHWLETDPAILELRKIGAWPDLSDRIAGYSRYLRAVEHSAQIFGAELTRREDAFKQGKINLMSCSTTMEMGVDIGGLTGVAMNNAPPHPANFLQRAGRAGRRGETAAFSFTLCKATPHGEAVFRNPLWPFVTRLAMPRVEMRSAPILQRHINALALAGFLRERAPERIHKLNTGWFFKAMRETESAPCERFSEWCRDEANRAGSLTDGIQTLIRRSVLEGAAPAELLGRVAGSTEGVTERWRRELQALLDQQYAVKTQDGDSKAEVAIKIQLDRLRGEYLLGELAALGFLPGYGFPTNVVPFVTTTLEDVERKQRQDRKEREDNRGWRAGYPSRNLAIAIRDYAPGTDTVLDQRVYRSEGVTLNWHLPASMEGAPEIQSLRYVWQCRVCGGSGTRSTWPERCPHCGENNESKLRRQRFLQPAGFAVDLRCKPHNNVSTPQYIPVQDPLISLEGAEWMNLASVGRYRASNQGHIFQYSNGLYERGFALCLTCGRADSLLPDGRLPSTFVEDVQKQGPLRHKRLRGGRLNDREKNCPGNDSDWSIQRGVWLGVVSWTDVMELQLRAPNTGKAVDDKVAAYTLAVALRRALCLSLGIEEGEVGCATLPGRDPQGQPATSIFLYDAASGGAGYTTQAPALLPDLFRKAREEVLECPRGCDSACQGCVLTYDTQHHLEHLDRQAALALLSSEFLDALELPGSLKVFGAGSRLEIEPLTLALRREWQRQTGAELRVYLGGEPEAWEPLAWRLRDDLMRFSQCGARIRLLLPASLPARLADSQRDELAALAAEIRAELLGLPEETATVGASKLPLILELVRPTDNVRWAATRPVAPGSLWGSGEGDIRYIVASTSGGLPELQYPAITPESLRTQSVAGITELRISREFDGPSLEFGRKAWNLIRQQAPGLAARLNGAASLGKLCYSDRYLRSPLVLHLLYGLFDALRKYSGGISSDTQIEVRTSELECRDERPPILIQHDWRDAVDRRSAAECMFYHFSGFAWQEIRRRDLPHARELLMLWPDGERWSIRLDQGLGYWEPVSHLRIPFPFDKEPEQQAEHMAKLNLAIQASGGGHPTFWYCGNHAS
jgi:DEAD/DEAH box helicase domain-containing protein